MTNRTDRRQRHFTGKATIFVLILALVVGIVGCVEGAGFEYNLTISSTAGGSVTDPGEGSFSYDYGEVVELVAEAGPGYRFLNWTGNVGTVDDVEAAETTIILRGDYSIVAAFEVIPGLTISSTPGGSVITPGEGLFTYGSDTVVTLVALADECHRFVKWTGDVVADPYSAVTTTAVTTDRASSVVASFTSLRYELATNSTAGGSITAPGEGTFQYECGAVVALVASPDAGYRFAGWNGDVEGFEDAHAAEATIEINLDRAIMAIFVREYAPMVEAGILHTIGLNSDGTVVATGWNEYGQCEVGEWMDIIWVAGGEHHTVGVKSGGTVVAVGDNRYGQCDVGDWTDIVQVDAGKFHTVGLRSDGTVVAAGWNTYRQCDVDDWTDIVQIAAGFYHTLGLRSDGTVLAVGPDAQRRTEVGDWRDIVQVAAGGHQSLGLRSDGTVLAIGRNNYGELNIDDWTDIVQVAGGCQVSVGLKADRTVVAAGLNAYGQCNVTGWTDIVQVTAGLVHTVGLRSDGTVVAAGRNHYGQCDVGEWLLGSAGG